MTLQTLQGCEAVGLGQCSWDLLGRMPAYPQCDGKVELTGLLEQGGGPVATALVTLARLGIGSAFLGSVGGDAAGGKIRRSLEDEGIDCRGLQVDTVGTSQQAFIAVEEATGLRTIFWSRGARQPYRWEDSARQRIAQARVLLLDGSEPEAALEAASWARRHGVVTVLDGGSLRPGGRELLAHIDHPVVCEAFAAALGSGSPQNALPFLLEQGATAATVTCGAGGSYSLEAGGSLIHQPAFEVPVVDTTGCGDVFHGGYLYGLLQGWPLPQRLRFAAACAALKAGEPGGRSGIPGLDRVARLLGEDLV